MNDTVYINNYVKNTKNVSFYIILAIFFILLFIFGPLHRFIITSILGKIIIIGVLFYALYENTTSTMNFSKYTKTLFTDGSWNSIKTNIIFGYVFSIFILLLIIKIITSFF